MKQKNLTVIVPVYKVEPYINKCLDSLLVPEEIRKDLEVIIINDGTPDRSAEMARAYERNYPATFRVIDKSNGGHGSAWNLGLKEANGKYIRFLDSDDWVDTAEFTRLLSRLKELDVDLVLSHYNRYYVQTGELIKHPMFKEACDRTYDISSFEWNKLSWEGFNFWGCTYKTSVLKEEYPLFLEGVYYDDAILFIAPLFLCKTIHVFDATIYNYLIGRPGQTMAPEVKRRHLISWVKTHFQVFEFGISHLNPSIDQNRKNYLVGFYKEWIHSCLVRLTDAPFSQCKELSAQCYGFYQQLQSRIPETDLSSKTILLYNKLPFPIYYFTRRLLRKVMKTN